MTNKQLAITIALVFVSIPMALVIMAPTPKPTKEQAALAIVDQQVAKLPPPTAEELTANVLRAQAEQPKPTYWETSKETDELTAKPYYLAQTESTNQLAFEWPYHGLQHATLSVRQHPRYGQDAIVQIEKGQILCRSYSGCQVKVRFDSDPVQTFSAHGAADHSSETIFFDNSKRFVERLKRSKSVTIELSVYHNGQPTVSFKTAGFPADFAKR